LIIGLIPIRHTTYAFRPSEFKELMQMKLTIADIRL
jgi:hypothetical protein